MHEVDVFLDKVICRQVFTKSSREFSMHEVDRFLDRVEEEFRYLDEQLLAKEA